MTFRERLAERVTITPEGCWDWTGHVDKWGYGKLSHALAHRTAYEAFVGPIPDGLEIDHLCRNRACVNPAHLEPVTRRENQIRGMAFSGQNARKTHCVNGHVFDEDNTYIRPSGHRDCRMCFRERTRRYRQRVAA